LPERFVRCSVVDSWKPREGRSEWGMDNETMEGALFRAMDIAGSMADGSNYKTEDQSNHRMALT
jgi:hypothetical protein